MPASKILLDVTRLLTRLSQDLHPTGVDRVGLAYIERYREHAHAVLSESGFSVVLTEKDSQHLFNRVLSSKCNRNELARWIARALMTRVPASTLAGSILLHTSHNGMEYGRYYRSMARRRARAVFMVHDLIPLTHAEYCRPGVEATHRNRIHTALAKADGLIANSEATLISLRTEAERAGLQLPPTVVAPLAPAVMADAIGPAPVASPYFVMLGTIEPRKNHWFILHVWRQLVELHGARAPKLVIIGRRGWECENTVDMLERCHTIRDAVIEDSQCSDDRLQTWLRHARALLFPTFAEGYGMPLVEALALGVPVLASDLPVFQEIAGDIPDYLDPLDGPGWRSRILAYADTSSPERAQQLARIASFSPPTWRDHFEYVDRFVGTLPA
ncbi:glycosyltransferase family 4 protein [Burkholderia diffusa]|uniref:glycosyltransferase family 4 protein n=1 Tax=Burkholderia diffusa TaxID=488732 RepID=UPI000758488F|nr:glycosyltransferase family 1 protein [Burkholderia diffusa]KVM91090.1 hypothetical protein WJ62_02820 [Burkholderia diffusa]